MEVEKREDINTVIGLERGEENSVLWESIAKEVGQIMRAHLAMDRNDPIEANEKGDDQRNKLFKKRSKDRP